MENVHKTKIVHFRQKQTPVSSFNFKIGDKSLEIVKQYKYLGVMINENLNFDVTAELLAGAAMQQSIRISY